jgi:hypothetical protein
VFGGWNNNEPKQTLTRTGVLKIDCKNFKNSKIQHLNEYDAD